MANQYGNYGVPPPNYGQDDSGQGGYGNSDYGGGYGGSRGGGGGYNKGGNFGGNRGGFNKGGGGGGGPGGDIVTQADTIFVSGMDPEASEYQINEHFGSIGIIKKDKRTQKPKIWIYRNKETGAGKGECTITYDDANAASSAIDWFDGKEFMGRQIKVSLAQRNNTWQQKGGRGGGGGGGRGGFGGGNRGGFGGDDRPPRGGNDDRGPRGGRDGGGGGGGQSREGDWLCSSCQNKNFAWRNECNRCKEPKGDDAGSGGGGGRGGPPQRGGFQNRDRNSGGGGGGFGGRGGGRGGFGGGDRGGFGGGDRGSDRGGAMRGGDRFSGGNRQRPY